MLPDAGGKAPATCCCRRALAFRSAGLTERREEAANSARGAVWFPIAAIVSRRLKVSLTEASRAIGRIADAIPAASEMTPLAILQGVDSCPAAARPSKQGPCGSERPNSSPKGRPAFRAGDFSRASGSPPQRASNRRCAASIRGSTRQGLGSQNPVIFGRQMVLNPRAGPPGVRI
jgi:hypothetical protein